MERTSDEDKAAELRQCIQEIRLLTQQGRKRAFADAFENAKTLRAEGFGIVARSDR